MRVIGIVGGVASGKSLVASQLAELGATPLDADRAGHEVLRLPHVETAARARWGADIFDAAGRIDRRRLAAIVFAPTEEAERERRYLEQLTHPEIERRLAEQMEQARAAGAPAVVVDAAVMLEAGWDAKCDLLVYVDAPRAQRLARARGRGWSEAEFAARENAQQPLEAKRRRADLVIDNCGPPEQTRAQLERLWRERISGGDRARV